jgi:hypothetical protein
MAGKEVEGNAAGEGQAAAAQGGGSPLPSTVARQMEMRFGHDFSDVRVHTAPNAAFRLHGVDAIAYTRGENIHFAPGKYDPHSSKGQNVLAHELTHVVQQRAGRVSIPDGSSNAGPAAGTAIGGFTYGISLPAGSTMDPLISPSEAGAADGAYL